MRIKGFAREFEDLTDYILKCTAMIREPRA